jgi:hypothetical protein
MSLVVRVMEPPMRKHPVFQSVVSTRVLRHNVVVVDRVSGPKGGAA